MDTSLKLYYLNGNNQYVAFPAGGASQAELFDFTLNKTRMGNAPTITGSLEYRTCLDSEWNNGHKFDDVFVEFNGEKFFLKATPSSSKSNEKDVYRHDLNFVSERIVLEHVIVVDCVGNETQNIIPSGSDEMVFFGDIRAFAERINQSMYFSDIGDTCMYNNGSMVPINQRTLNNDGYYIVVDESVESGEEKLISLGETMVLDALKEAVEKFSVPFYFVGRVIHFGSYKPVVLQGYAKDGVLGAGVSGNNLVPYEYGAEHSLLSVQRNNKNVEIITRCSGRGSEDNIPFYYPNNSPKGFLSLQGDPENTGDDVVIISNYTKFSASMQVDAYIQCISNQNTHPSIMQHYIWGRKSPYLIDDPQQPYYDRYLSLPSLISVGDENGFCWCDWTYYKTKTFCNYNGSGSFSIKPNLIFVNETDWEHTHTLQGGIRVPSEYIDSVLIYKDTTTESDDKLTYYGKRAGDSFYFSISSTLGFLIIVNYKIPKQFFIDVASQYGVIDERDFSIYISLDYNWGVEPLYAMYLSNGDDVKNSEVLSLRDVGLKLESGMPDIGDKLYQRLIKYIKPQKHLMPSVYRNSDGAKIFYPAKNYPVSGSSGDEDADIGETYHDGQIANGNYEITKGVYYVFENLYRRLKQSEHIEDFNGIKPTIKEIYNTDSHRIDMFLDIAFDTHDTNDGYYDESGNYVYNHPYFFVKLRRTDGVNGFNIFDSAIDEQDMSISMTSGHCAPCEFVIGVDEDTKKNLVQVDNNGNLLRDASGNVRCGREGLDVEIPQDRQNDTRDYEVWLALKKDIDTFGEVLPKVGAMKPSPCSSASSDDGDTFVILHIQLPDTYFTVAENRLTKAIIQHMYEHNFEAFDQSLNYSRAYLRDNSNVANVLDDCIKVSTKYNNITRQMLVNTYSYKMQSTSPVPEITLGLIDEEDLIERIERRNGFVRSVVSESIRNGKKSIESTIKRNNVQLTNGIMMKLPGDTVKSDAKNIYGDIMVGAGGRDIMRIPSGQNGQVLKIVNGFPTWVDQS